MHGIKPAIQIDTYTCDQCGLCVRVCDKQVIEFCQDRVAAEHAESCGGCGMCEELCPQGAILLQFDIVWDSPSPGDTSHAG